MLKFCFIFIVSTVTGLVGLLQPALYYLNIIMIIIIS